MTKIKQVTAIILILVLSFVIDGCKSAAGYNYSWDIYEFPMSDYKTERQKLVDITEDILIRKGFFIENKSEFEMGKEGTLRTEWNNEQAMNTMSSHVGYRLRIRVLISEDIEQFQGPQNDPNTRPYLEMFETGEEKQKIVFGVSVEKEKNTAIPRFLGDLESAEWEAEGFDDDYAFGIQYEIKHKYQKISRKELKDGGYTSDLTAKIREREGKPIDESEDPENEKPSYDDLFTDKDKDDKAN